MSGEWYEGIPDDAFVTDADKAYEKAFAIIRQGIAQGLGFDDACGAIDVPDQDLRLRIIDDMLKVLIAEQHFGKKIPLDDLAQSLKLDISRLERARKEMFRDVEEKSVSEFYRNLQSGDE